MNCKIIILGIVIFVLLVLVYYICSKTFKYYSNKNKYNGLVLFDIDGTLTENSKDENHDIVDYCLRNKYAVGISTAGSIYSMQNLLSFPWMPRNLYDFILNNNNVTFNNVRSGYVCGKFNPDPFNKIFKGINRDLLYLCGYAKGYTMHKTSQELQIINPNKLILCDDMREFINGYLGYNKEYNYIFCGDKEGLSLDKIKKLI